MITFKPHFWFHKSLTAKMETLSYLFLFFFLPFTCFSRLLILWLITEDEDILWSEILKDDSAGDDVAAACLAATNCLSRLKADGDELLAGVTGISGTPKDFFTPGTLSTERDNERTKMFQLHIILTTSAH